MAARAGPPTAAVMLAGGRAGRLGGADKPGIEVGGRSMLASVAAAAAGAGARHLVVVGPARPAGMLPAGMAIDFTTERPPGAGPVPALRAGLLLVTEPWLLLLAADLPFLRDSHLRELVAAAGQAGAAALVDDDGRAQWLVSCWRADDLRTALTAYRGNSLGGLLGPLCPAEVTVPAGQAAPWLDCDTPEDLAAARALAGDAHEESQTMSTLQKWIDAACAELGIDQAVVDERVVLDLAREVAHQVDRPAAPVTAFLLGVAAGRGQPVGQAADRLTALAARWHDAP
jgi:molybdopterin-guanine dinucleotide biosynthesis protein A